MHVFGTCGAFSSKMVFFCRACGVAGDPQCVFVLKRVGFCVATNWCAFGGNYLSCFQYPSLALVNSNDSSYDVPPSQGRTTDFSYDKNQYVHLLPAFNMNKLDTTYKDISDSCTPNGSDSAVPIHGTCGNPRFEISYCPSSNIDQN